MGTCSDVNDFDDEPGTGGGYQMSCRDGSSCVCGFGRQMRAAVVLEEQRGGTQGQVIRFDDAHRRFHRHHPGWPEPGAIAEFLDGVERRRRAAYAREQIRRRYSQWEADLFGKEDR